MMKFYLEGRGEGGLNGCSPGKSVISTLKTCIILRNYSVREGEGERDGTGKMYRDKIRTAYKSKKIFFLIHFEDFSYLKRTSKPS